MLKCREKLARKEYKTGELYRKMAYWDAAVLYFEAVLSSYYDTDFAEDAQFWIAECLRKNNEYDRAIEEFAKYLRKYPESDRREQAQKLLGQSQKAKTKAEKNVTPEDNSTTASN